MFIFFGFCIFLELKCNNDTTFILNTMIWPVLLQYGLFYGVRYGQFYFGMIDQHGTAGGGGGMVFLSFSLN